MDPPAAAASPFVPRTPFDDTGADTILRASDGVDFHVYRQVLSLSSPFFKDLFSIPQPESEPEVPVIPVAESSHLLDRLLRMFYPGTDSLLAVEGVDELAEIIELLVSKYEIQFAIPLLQRHLRAYMETNPLAVYAIACRYRWADLAKATAKLSLKFSLPTLIRSSRTPHLRQISAHLYHALLLYHVKSAEVASSAGALLPWSKATWTWITCTTCTAYSLRYNVPGLPTQRIPRAWIFDYIDRASALLKEKPGTNLADLEILPPTLAKIAMCPGTCRVSGFQDLVTFIRDEYVPKVNEALDGVTVELDF
ncbi:hypothetical protein B0H19DRAFT_989184 [Mycena capillaripes]|nr:hypothetical protein B0H19DRAFT_989184 [Mycena capillaripes]